MNDVVNPEADHTGAGDPAAAPGAADREASIRRSWQTNADAWAHAVASASIESRRLVTDAAIVGAITTHAALGARVLDIGCGEGWLARRLADLGYEVFGFDAEARLVDVARGGASRTRFDVCSYEQFAAGDYPHRDFDLAVANFSLLGELSVEQLLRALPLQLNGTGTVAIQTLHPCVACGARDYADGWREGSWAGVSGAFSDPAPWYFRTTQSWIASLVNAGFELLECLEPTVPGGNQPSSIIFVGRLHS